MPSRALEHWRDGRARELDMIERAHARVGGTGAGRRHTTQQLNQAYAVLVSSHFQGFCRDLHSEAAAYVAGTVEPVAIRRIIQVLLTRDRQLDRGNVQPSSIGNDFGRFGMAFWPTVTALSGRNPTRQGKIELLNTWRNAIAHQDFTRLGGATTLRIGWVRSWRSACNGLAGDFDRAVASHVVTLVGTRPW